MCRTRGETGELDSPHLSAQPRAMCNLYKLERQAGEIGKLFNARADAGNAGPGLVYPKYEGMVIRNDEEGRVVNGMTWGFPRVMRSKRTGEPLKPTPVNNARSEKLATPFWVGSAKNPSMRCIIPVSALAEAMGPKGEMTTTWLSLPDQPVFGCAGLWRDSAEWGRCYTMVMCDNRPDLEYVHDRMPVILDPADYDRWLEAPLNDIKTLCKPWEGQIDVEETDVKWGRQK